MCKLGLYTKRPIIFEAYEYQKGLEDGFACKDNKFKYDCLINGKYCESCDGYKPFLESLEGKDFIDKDLDMIVFGVMGDKYLCHKDKFIKQYMEVDR
jgi:hypothetical protein